MSEFYNKVDYYKKVMYELGLEFDADLLTAVTKGLGPSIYKENSEILRGTSEEDLTTVKQSFLNKKLGVYDESRYDDAISYVVNKMGAETKKYRAIFYYLLVKKLRREYVYE
ncbi:hypothetical protein KH5_01480 [Urechidicola sp. KH5]